MGQIASRCSDSIEYMHAFCLHNETMRGGEKNRGNLTNLNVILT